MPVGSRIPEARRQRVLRWICAGVAVSLLTAACDERTADSLPQSNEDAMLPVVVAHRGGAAYAPENTLAAIRIALRDGVAGVEFDVRLSSDGVPVLMHDDDLERTTNGRGKVSDHTLDELGQLNAGSWFGDDFSGEPVPSLEDVLSLVEGKCELYVEIKGGEHEHPGITTAVLDAIDRHSAESWCRIMSFHNTSLEIVRRQAPNMKTTKLMVGRIPWTSIHIDHGLRSSFPSPEGGVDAVGINHHLASQSKVRELHDRGLDVFIWTPNTEGEIAAAIGTGADAIITDAPRLARSLISSNVPAQPAF